MLATMVHLVWGVLWGGEQRMDLQMRVGKLLNDPAGPFEGEYLAAMGCSGSPCSNESIFKDVDLDINKNYKLSFHHRTGTYGVLVNVNVYVYLTNGFVNVLDPSFGSCDDLDLPDGSSLLFSENSFGSSEWLSVETTFSPVEGMNQLLFFVEPVGQTSSATYWLVDGVSLEECDQCEASFEVCQAKDCTVHLINTSTPSAENDCGDCENPTGLVSTSWSITEYHNGPPPYVSMFGSSQNYNTSFKPTSTDNDGYQICLRIEDCSGCTSQYCEVFQFKACKQIGVSEQRASTESNISNTTYLLYPNPVRDQIQLEIESDQTFDGVLKIYDFRGKLVKQVGNIKSGYSSINVESMSTGVYLFNVINDGKIDYSEKIMIE